MRQLFKSEGQDSISFVNNMGKDLEQHNTDDISVVTATRKDLQLPRRLFHMGSGICVAFIYNFLLTHQQAVSILGTIACVLYILEQVRINYPEFSGNFEKYSKYLLRAEEQLKESAGVPFVMGLLLTILSFPKPVAVVAILTLAVADPLSAIIGIRFGRLRVVAHKSIEGSGAFFLGCFVATCVVFLGYTSTATALGLGFFVAFTVSIFEMMPIRLDDNLTIPLFTGAITWLYCIILGIATV